MVAPRLIAIEDAPRGLVSSLPRLPRGRDVQGFVVVRDGRWQSSQWRVGDVVVCRGDATQGDDVVLLPAGHGRPQFGSIKGIRLYGAEGEPCHPARWHVAGKIVLAYRQQSDGWMVELRDAMPTRQTGGQLSLFSAVAA